MGVINKKFNNHFTQIFNVCYFDKRLTYEDIGVYSQLCSLPDKWKISIRKLDDLHDISKTHKSKIAESINRLIVYGYIHRVSPKKKFKDNGKFENYDYELYSSPFDNPHLDANSVPEELIKIYVEQFMNSKYCSPVLIQDRNQSAYRTVTVPIQDNINTNLVNKNINIVVDEKRFINAIYPQKLRYDEANRTEEYSNKAIQYAIDSFNCFGESQIKKINNLSDSQYESLFALAYDFANQEGEYNEVMNAKKVFSTRIKSFTRNISA